jgi:hypothetical protein
MPNQREFFPADSETTTDDPNRLVVVLVGALPRRSFRA